MSGLLLCMKLLLYLVCCDVNNGTVVKNAVKDSRGDCDVGKDVVPLRESFVGGKDISVADSHKA